MTKKSRQTKPGKGNKGTIRLLPVLIIFAFVSLGVRVSDFVDDVQDIRLTTQVQAADEQVEMAEAEEKTEEVPADAVDEIMQSTTLQPLPSALDGDIEFSQERIQIFSELAQRRDELDQRESQLRQRETLLKAAELQFDAKLDELKNLRGEIQELLSQQEAEEQARIASLVKIYEGMKAKDAARIFNTLEVPVLLAVVGRMSERKSAPILAAMQDDRARKLTILLAEQKQLPQLPSE